MAAEPAPDPPADRISYADFGRGFFAHAVTEERILAGFSGLAGDPIEFGPIGAGPGKIAQIKADGEVGQPSVQRQEADELSFLLTIPVDLDLEIDLGLDRHIFHVKVDVALTITARAAPPLRVVIDIEKPTARDVTVDIGTDTIRAALFQRVAGVDNEIRRFVAKYIGRELEKPHIVAARDIDIAERIDAGWRRAALGGPDEDQG
jgi:hypothetical protein